MNVASVLVASSLLFGAGPSHPSAMLADTLGYCSAVYATSLNQYAATTNRSAEGCVMPSCTLWRET